MEPKRKSARRFHSTTTASNWMRSAMRCREMHLSPSGAGSARLSARTPNSQSEAPSVPVLPQRAGRRTVHHPTNTCCRRARTPMRGGVRPGKSCLRRSRQQCQSRKESQRLGYRVAMTAGSVADEEPGEPPLLDALRVRRSPPLLAGQWSIHSRQALQSRWAIAMIVAIGNLPQRRCIVLSCDGKSCPGPRFARRTCG